MKTPASKTQTHQKNANLTSQTVRCKAPAKLILSGEHSVLYHCPALSLAIKLYSHCESHYTPLAHVNAESSFILNLIDYEHSLQINFYDLIQKANHIEKGYQAFINEQLAIADVLKQPTDLFIVALNIFHQKYTLKPGHWIFNLTSDIPTGRGLGSSASVIVSFLCNLFQQQNIPLDKAELLKLAQSIENRQHGKSSGLDPATIIYGGLIHFQNGKIQEQLNSANLAAWLVDTGPPLSSTGEAVLMVKNAYSENIDLWSAFSDCSLEILHCLEKSLSDIDTQQNESKLPALINKNQLLLEQIGIVPNKVCNFIRFLKQPSAEQSFVAKVCGSGSVRGESAGALLVMPNQHLQTENWHKAEQTLQDECLKMNYTLNPIEADNNGVFCEVNKN